MGCREVAADSRLVGPRLRQDGGPSHGDPRLRPRRRASVRAAFLKLITYESPNRDRFLRDVADRSPNRVVKGQATLALAQYLWMKALHVEMIQHPDSPENVDKMRLVISSTFGPDSVAGSNPPVTEAPAMLRKQRDDFAIVLLTTASSHDCRPGGLASRI